MNLLITPDYSSLSRQAASLLASLVHRRPEAVLILAAGATPLGAYAELAQLVRAGQVDFTRTKIFALDEWGGLPRDHPASCHATLLARVAGPLHLSLDRFSSLDGVAPDPAAECRHYAAALTAAGPADLALVGLGVNGHIAFNEPADELLAEAGVAALSPETVARLRPDLNGQPAPDYGLTLSLAEVMAASEILLLANGRSKAGPVQQALTGPLTTHCPASLLRLHPRVTVILDDAAAAQLPLSLRRAGAAA